MTQSQRVLGGNISKFRDEGLWKGKRNPLQKIMWGNLSWRERSLQPNGLYYLSYRIYLISAFYCVNAKPIYSLGQESEATSSEQGQVRCDGIPSPVSWAGASSLLITCWYLLPDLLPLPDTHPNFSFHSGLLDFFWFLPFILDFIVFMLQVFLLAWVCPPPLAGYLPSQASSYRP